MHHHHHRGAGGFYPGAGGVFYGLPSEVNQPVVVEAPPLKQSDDLRYTCVYDIPWDYVHRCPQFTTPRQASGRRTMLTLPGAGGGEANRITHQTTPARLLP